MRHGPIFTSMERGVGETACVILPCGIGETACVIVQQSVVPARRLARRAVPLRQAVAIAAFAAGCTFAALLAADGGEGGRRGEVRSMLGRSVPEGGAKMNHLAPRARDLARSCGLLSFP